MLEAIIAAILAAAAVIGITIAVVSARTRKLGPKLGKADDFRELNTFGVGSGFGDADTTGTIRVGEEPGGIDQTDAFAPRFAALGALGAAIFATLTAKLYSMQIMAGANYASDAEENLYVDVATPAARGMIYDTHGRVLVRNRASQTVLADGTVANDSDVVRRLSAVLGLPANIVRSRIADTSAGIQSQRVVASDTRLRDVAFISEHADAFSGVVCETRTVRDYPYGALAAHVLGYTGTPSKEQLQGVETGREVLTIDTIGLSGVEAYYDSALSGDHGTRRMMIDAQGNVVEIVSERESSKGSDIYLCLDAPAQYKADTLLAETIAPTSEIGSGRGIAGACVALDVRTGAVLVMSSYPTFDPGTFTGGIPQSIWDVYNTEESQAPLNNRAVNAQYAAASTYKAFTSLAGLEHGFADAGTLWDCKGEWDGFGSGDIQKCWNTHGHKMLDLYGGIVNSCDVVFYEIAKAFYAHGPDGTGQLTETALQDYLAKFRFGQATGIDLYNESVGRIPTPAWKAEQWRNVPSEANWRGGDYSNMIIGQGDVLVTPLQIAVAYGAIATGKLMKPHLLKEVRNAKGETVVSFQPEVLGEPDVNPVHLDYVRKALRGVITDNKAVAERFAYYEVPAAGKSGTAEHTDRADDSWFVAYAPYDNPRYVCACMIEQGGGGSDTASPIVAAVLGSLLKGETDAERTVERIAGSTGRALLTKFAASDAGRTD